MINSDTINNQITNNNNNNIVANQGISPVNDSIPFNKQINIVSSVKISEPLLNKNSLDTDSKFLDDVYRVAPWSELLSSNNLTLQRNLKNRDIFNIQKKDSVPTTSKTFDIPLIHSKEYQNIENNTILSLIIATFVLLAWIKITFSKYLNQIVRATFNYSEAYKLYRDYNTLIERVYLILNIIFTLSGGIFCYHCLKYFKPYIFKDNQIYILIFCFGFILLIYFFRYSINKIIGFILNQTQTFNEYLHSSFVYLKVSGLFLLPFISIISFIADNYIYPLIVLGIIIFFVLYFISIYRATRIMLQKGILLFYWILYLCTVEFLPIILFYKYFNTIV